MLNKELLHNQKVTPAQENKLNELYLELATIISASIVVSNDDAPALSKRLEQLEYDLQSNWNFPPNSAYHRYQKDLIGCTCSTMDTKDLPAGLKWVNNDCKYHGQPSQ